MSRRYTHTLSLSIGGDIPTWEGEAEVSYAVTWGAPERGPTYDCGGTPADPDEIDDIRVVKIDGVSITQRPFGKFEAETLETHIECDERLLGELLAAACEADTADREDAMERRADEPTPSP